MQTSARFPEDDPQESGHIPDEPEGIPPGDDLPGPSWSLERLASYAKNEVTTSFFAEQQAILQAHKSAVHLFRAGHALALARSKCKGEQHGDWKKFKKKHGLADTTANDAIRLYESAKTEDALVGLGITEAKLKFGIAGHKKKKPSPHPKPAPGVGPAHRPDNEEGETDKNDIETAVTKESAGSGSPGSDKDDTSKKTDDMQQQAAGGTDIAGEQAQTLIEKLEEIAQRLSEINQDTFGKIHWNKTAIRKARRALVALNNHAIAINRRLINEE